MTELFIHYPKIDWNDLSSIKCRAVWNYPEGKHPYSMFSDKRKFPDFKDEFESAIHAVKEARKDLKNKTPYYFMVGGPMIYNESFDEFKSLTAFFKLSGIKPVQFCTCEIFDVEDIWVIIYSKMIDNCLEHTDLYSNYSIAETVWRLDQDYKNFLNNKEEYLKERNRILKEYKL